VSETPELAELRATVSALADRVKQLEDQVAIGRLIARYGPAVDSGSAAAAARLWTDDGVFAAPPHGVWTGHDEIAGMVNGAGHQGLINNGVGHVLTAPLIALDGDEATAWNYALNIRWDGPQDRFWVARVSANRWRLRRTSGGWQFTDRTSRTLDGAPESRAVFAETASLD
jgi:hypothetical protein